jgi:hypothetical protein
MPEEEATAAANPRVGAVVDDVFGVEGEKQRPASTSASGCPYAGWRCCYDSCDGVAVVIHVTAPPLALRPLARTHLADTVAPQSEV